MPSDPTMTPMPVRHWRCRHCFSAANPRVTAVTQQWRLINQKCQRHLCCYHSDRTRDLPRLCPCVLWSLSSHANQCQSMPVQIGRAVYHNARTCLPRGQAYIRCQWRLIEAVKHLKTRPATTDCAFLFFCFSNFADALNPLLPWTWVVFSDLVWRVSLEIIERRQDLFERLQ